MQYRCPQCQSVKIMPVSQGVNSAKPVVPKSLVILVPAILYFYSWLLLVFLCGFWQWCRQLSSNCNSSCICGYCRRRFYVLARFA